MDEKSTFCHVIDGFHVAGIQNLQTTAGVLNVRLTPAIHRQIAMLALQAGVSINAYIKDALEEKVEEAETV
jgi:predicted HicB family RNase H-like nuclease